MILERDYNERTDKFCCTDLFTSTQDKDNLEKVAEMVDEIDSLLQEHSLAIEDFITREFSNGLIGFLETLSRYPIKMKHKLNEFIELLGE
jgi:predicted esterase